MRKGPPERDSLHLEGADAAAIHAALEDDAADDGMVPCDVESVPPHGRWIHGEDDPMVRRFLVAPPGPRWTVVLLGTPDWERAWVQRISARLGCRSACLQLTDGDVLAVQLHDSGDLMAEHVTSRDHFDLPPAPPDPRLALAIEALIGRRLGSRELDAVLFPPGDVDVDGARAFTRLSRLLDLDCPPGGYRDALEEDGRTPKRAYAGWKHLVFRVAEDEPAEERSGGKLLAFRPK